MNRSIEYVLAGLIVLAMPVAFAGTGRDDGAMTQIGPLVDEALANNPDLEAARAESAGAEQRIAPAGSLEDPMLEAGLLNAPVPSLSLRQDDMTMKMLGLSQRLPFPGKRGLRMAVAAADSESIAAAVSEMRNRIVRDVRVAYEELRLAQATERIMSRSRDSLQELASISQSRFAVGQAAQADVLQAQMRIADMQQEILRLQQEKLTRESAMRRLLGRNETGPPIMPASATLLPLRADAAALAHEAAENRPQLHALNALVDKGDRAIELAAREFYPDFEVKLGYGQRDRMPDGLARADMITLTVAVNLPIWRRSRLEPKVAEARAMRRQALAAAASQRLETLAGLEQQLALERQSRASAELYRTTLLPQARAVVESALNGYRVGRVDFLTLLDAQMQKYTAERGEAEAIAKHNEAIAEIDLLTGVAPVTEGARP